MQDHESWLTNTLIGRRFICQSRSLVVAGKTVRHRRTSPSSDSVIFKERTRVEKNRQNSITGIKDLVRLLCRFFFLAVADSVIIEKLFLVEVCP